MYMRQHLEEVISEAYATEWGAAGHVRTLKPQVIQRESLF